MGNSQGSSKQNALESIEQEILNLSDEALSRLSFSLPWQYDSSASDYKDPDKDKAVSGSTDKEDSLQAPNRNVASGSVLSHLLLQLLDLFVKPFVSLERVHLSLLLKLFQPFLQIAFFP